MHATSALLWGGTALFIATGIVTLLGIIKRPRLITIEPRWLKVLFSTLLVELAASGVAAWANMGAVEVQARACRSSLENLRDIDLLKQEEAKHAATTSAYGACDELLKRVGF